MSLSPGRKATLQIIHVKDDPPLSLTEPGAGGSLDGGQHHGHVARAAVGGHRVGRDGGEPLRARQRRIQGRTDN